MCCISAVWRGIVAQKKLLGILGLGYLVITLAVYNKSLMAMVTGNLWIDRANVSDFARNNSPITRSYGSIAIDTHLEDDALGHTGEIVGEYSSTSPFLANHDLHKGTVIAIGTAITSKGTKGINEGNIRVHLQVFTALLPTFCATVSSGYNFQFYFAYDKTDPVFTNPSLLQAFQRAFSSILDRKCPKDLEVGIHFVQCSHTGKPTWAQNDAMLEAYIDNVDYFYRVNDDTSMQTKGWVEEFIKTLKAYDPPNVGVVGPNHSGGNTAILTYDFVHRTHVDIFGFYYPKLFTDWWGDDWVTYVYNSGGRSTKLKHIRLTHTMRLGQRYRTDQSVGGRLQGRLRLDRITLSRYLERMKSRNTITKPDRKRIVAMTLIGKDPKDTWGAIRNAQLMPIVFPQWTLRFYVPSPEFVPANVSTTRSEAVPRRILSKLRQLGSEIVHVKTTTGSDKIQPKYWRYLVTMDETVEYFLIRDVDSRISDRDSAAVNDWMQETDIPALHCVRDHPKHADSPMVDGLWGGRTSKLRGRLKGKNLMEIIQEFDTSTPRALVENAKNIMEDTSSTDALREPVDILSDVLWPMLTDDVLCHDSVSCEKWKNTRSFPATREKEEYMGQKFDERQESTSDDLGQLNPVNPLCNGKGLYSTKTNSTPS